MGNSAVANTAPTTQKEDNHPVIEIPDPDNLPEPTEKSDSLDKLSKMESDDEETSLYGTETISSGPIRWIRALREAIEKYPKSTVIQIATLDSSTNSQLPKNRCHIFRKLMEPETEPNLPLLLTTTDIRTPKVDQMVRDPNVEVVWWIEGEIKQWRFNCTVSVIPTPDHHLYRNFKAMWGAHRDPMSGLDMLRKEGFDWEKQRLESFRSLGPHLRATFCRPTPGSKLMNGSEEAKKWPEIVQNPEEFEGGDEGREDNQRNWDKAFENFALVVLDPVEVDYLDMSVIPNRRWKQWLVQTKWVEQEVVP